VLAAVRLCAGKSRKDGLDDIVVGGTFGGGRGEAEIKLGMVAKSAFQVERRSFFTPLDQSLLRERRETNIVSLGLLAS